MCANALVTQSCDGCGQWGAGVMCPDVEACSGGACVCATPTIDIHIFQVGSTANYCMGQAGTNQCTGFTDLGHAFTLSAGGVTGISALYICYDAANVYYLSTSSACENIGTFIGPIGNVANSPLCGTTQVVRYFQPSTGANISTNNAAYGAQLASQGWTVAATQGFAWP
jgi:hypothetical protein